MGEKTAAKAPKTKAKVAKPVVPTNGARASEKPQTMAERGPVLPLGIGDTGGTLHQDLSVRPWRMKEERELGALRDEHKSANLAEYVSMVLATMCTRLGPHDMDGMKFAERRLVIGQMFMADVFYAYVWLRIQALGADLPIKFNPRWSAEAVTVHADLNTVEVVSAKSVEEASWQYELKNPIEIRGVEVTEFKLAPPRWSTLESIEAIGGGSNDTGLQKSALIRSSVVECEGISGSLMLTDSELDELTKLDIETLTRLMDDKNLGPVMVVEGKHRGNPYRVPIDWGYDSFFAISST